MQDIYNKIIETIDKDRVYINEPMKKHTTFKVGGPADLYIKAKTQEELVYILKVSKENNIPVTVIGNGSNVLVKDKGIRGIVLKLDFNEINKIDENILEVGSGVLLSKLTKTAMEENLAGIEFLCGIPGTLGGAIYMNSGAYGEEIGNYINSITYVDENMEMKTIEKKEAQFSYRNSIFQHKNWIIISAALELKKGKKEEIRTIIEKYMEERIQKQPLDKPSAGSIFKREINFVTAKLIDECGLKGYSIGGAKISLKHAGFIVNENDATADDILRLVDYIKEKVKEKYNKDIELEIRILGE